MTSAVSVKPPVNGAVLRWARESIGVGPEKAAGRADVSIDIYTKWENGEAVPSMPRLRKLANLFKRPLPVFFLPYIPKTLPMPKDFRKPATIIKQPLSESSLIAIRKARWLQAAAGELMTDLGLPVQVAKFSGLKHISLEKLSETLMVPGMDIRKTWENNWVALKKWRMYLEDRGVFVFQFPFPIEEARGFSLVREGHPPVIVISSHDSPNARIFTLFHEYCHILSEESGLCIPSETVDRQARDKETLCDEFAGSFLVPTSELMKSIKSSPVSNIEALIPELSKKFLVSRFVILRRLYSLKEIDYKSYRALFNELEKSVKKADTAGGNFYKNQFAEKGKKFIGLVVEAESSGKITLSRALDYLGIKTRHYHQVVEMLYE